MFPLRGHDALHTPFTTFNSASLDAGRDAKTHRQLRLIRPYKDYDSLNDICQNQCSAVRLHDSFGHKAREHGHLGLVVWEQHYGREWLVNASIGGLRLMTFLK